MDIIKKLVGYPMKELVPLITDIVSEGKDVIITARGNSMRPMLRDAKDTVILRKPQFPLKKYDIPLYIRENNKFVLHRVISVKNGKYIIRGDNCNYIEDNVKDENVVAVLKAYVRNGKTHTVDSVFYKIYCVLWCNEVSYFLRKVAYPKFLRAGSKIKRLIIKNRH